MEAKRRVLYISYDCILEPLTSSQVLPYLKGLSRKNDIYLLTFNKARVSEGRLNSIAAANNLKGIFGLAYHKTPTLPATCFDITCGIIKGMSIIRRHGIALVHARSHVSCAIAFALKRLSGVSYIFDVRGLLADERVDSGDWQKGSIVYRVVKFCEALMLKSSSGIVLLSSSGVNLLDDIQRGSSARTTVIPTCVDTEIFSPPDPSRAVGGDLRLVYVGSLGTWYMLPEMLDFFGAVKKAVRQSKFTILTWSDPVYITKAIREKGLDEGSIEVKRAPHEGVPSYLASSDASIFFIRPTFSKRVSCPTKFAEALSMGLPVVANSGIGDIAHFIRKYSTGVVVDAFREESYKKAIDELMGMLKDRSGLSMRCRDLALAEFSLASGIRKYEALYEAVT